MNFKKLPNLVTLMTSTPDCCTPIGESGNGTSTTSFNAPISWCINVSKILECNICWNCYTQTQCDQIWRKLATLVKSYKSLVFFWVDLVLGIWTYCFMLLGKFYLLKMAKNCRNNLAIWSHWWHTRVVRRKSSLTSFAVVFAKNWSIFLLHCFRFLISGSILVNSGKLVVV